MPQVFIILGPDTQALFTEIEASDLGQRLMPLVEKAFGIERCHDMSFTAIQAIEADGETDVQVEIRYTVGRDEYDWGKPFNPTLLQQRKLIDSIRKEFKIFKKKNGLSDETLSVWCIPHRGGLFKMFKRGKKKD